MNRIARIVLCGALAAVAYGTVAAFASRAFGFRYSAADVGSYCIYAAVGYALARISHLSTAAWGSALVGLADATLGWRFSWLIGPGRPKSGSMSVGVYLVTLAFVLIISAALGTAAGIVGRARMGGHMAEP